MLLVLVSFVLGLVAQWLIYLTTDWKVVSSSPCTLTLKPWVYSVNLDKSVSQRSKCKCNAKGPGTVGQNSSTMISEMSAIDGV